ncbi:hypothetical protein CF392_06485 [Tamilnaduibacter salinus]|uniref:DUF6671 domain-containing protein n=1 Tax=Tamilnaduibacter salinus TaxID=1484056 RepID=A0A2A2I4I1_9GAMM|nr:DUF6671 family protein [Tamilnaduibacter salinus]PAV26308.1 hypothetical protein CF392_06485 [Tamilnaduibacter salinus]
MTIWDGRSAVLLTRHGKLPAIAGPLEPLGLSITCDSCFDTDRLGTFTRETERFAGQRETALEKARIAAAQGEDGIGLGSEGAFGGSLLCINLEVVCLYDSQRDVTLFGEHSAPFGLEQVSVRSVEELQALLDRCPAGQGVVMRPEHAGNPEIYKGLRDHQEIHALFRALRDTSPSGQVFVEYDLRAHESPGRMANIELAAENLRAKMESLCPECSLPGYWMTDIERGLPCSACDTPTQRPRAVIWSCQACDYTESRPVAAVTTKPEHCPTCNP